MGKEPSSSSSTTKDQPLKRRAGVTGTPRRPEGRTTRAARDEAKTSGASLRASGRGGEQAQAGSQQPDLVKISTPGQHQQAQHDEIDRLERLLQCKVSDIATLTEAAAHKEMSCQVMAVLLSRISAKDSPEERLRTRVGRLNKDVEEAREKLEGREAELRELEKKQEEEKREWEEERRRKVEEREEVEKAATAKLEQEVERLSKEGKERLAIEVERHTSEEERERQKHEEEKRLRREETDRALERLKEEQEVQTLRVKEEEEKVRRVLEGKVSELEGKLRCLDEAAE